MCILLVLITNVLSCEINISATNNTAQCFTNTRVLQLSSCERYSASRIIKNLLNTTGADKSLARLTSRFRRAESIVSLERGVCSCAELQVFSCYRGWKEACQATRAISTTSRRESALHCTTRVTTYMYCCHNTGIDRQDCKFSVFK